jgi:hypothetical protein
MGRRAKVTQTGNIHLSLRTLTHWQMIKTMLAWLGVTLMHFCMDDLSFAWVFGAWIITVTRYEMGLVSTTRTDQVQPCAQK